MANAQNFAHVKGVNFFQLQPYEECPDTDKRGRALQDPIISFRNTKKNSPIAKGVVVVGGFVYRGNEVPALQNQYVFGTWSQDRHKPRALFIGKKEAGNWKMDQLQPEGKKVLEHFLLGFCQDQEGELYVLTTDETGPTGNTGKVYKLVK